MRGAAGIALLLAMACKGPDAVEPAPLVDFLSPSEHLVRASMAVRGVRPSVEELDAVRSDPSALSELVDLWLETPHFGATIRDLHAELLLLRVDTTYQLPVYGILEERGYSQADVHHSTVEAPLRLVEDIVLSGRPYTEVVTAEDTLADAVVADIYGLPYDPEGPQWQATRWVDGRPHAGLLSDSQVWRRHVSNAQNFHRGRAAFVARTFLCEDISARDIVIDGGVDLADPFEVAHAVSTQDACVACHDVLDPLAATFWGNKEQIERSAVTRAHQGGCSFDHSDGPPKVASVPWRDSYRVDHWCYPLRFYVPSDEAMWQDFDLRPPAYFGRPVVDLADVGREMAEDPRFAQCTVRNVYAWLGQIDRAEVPLPVAAGLQDLLVSSGFDLRALVREIVLSDSFRIARVLDDPHDDVFRVGAQVVRPEQYARAVHDLTGFQWVADQDKAGCASSGNSCWETVDLARSDLYGFRSMMGGVDGHTVTEPTHTATPTKVLAMAQMAAEAAGYVVAQDLAAAPDARRLLRLVEEDTVDEATVRRQLAWLHLRILGERLDVDDPEIDAILGLMRGATEGAGDPAEGWRVVVSALLQDPRMMLF